MPISSQDDAHAAEAAAAEACLLEEFNKVRALHIAELRERACAAIEHYVDVLRIGGVPAERVVIAIKTVATNAGLISASDVRSSGTYTIHELLMAEIISCAVRRYFHDAP